MVEWITYALIAGLLVVSIMSVSFAVVYYFKLNRHEGEVQADVTLIMAMTGASPNFKHLIHQLNKQSLQPKMLLIGVESIDDPAYRMILDVASIAKFPVEVVIAGPSEKTAQKCWNQLAAASLLPSSCQHHVVLLDVDINPPELWLAALIKPLVNRRADVVSGYRWQQPRSYDFWAHIITSIDRSIAVLPKLDSANMIWGGSIAMRNEVFRSVLDARVLNSSITDDLAIAYHAKKMNFSILMRRILLVPSQAPEGLRVGYRFGVRQYQIIKIHRPRIWLLALGSALLVSLGWLALFYEIVFSKNSSLVLFWMFFFVYLFVAIKQVFVYAITKKIGVYDSTYQLVMQFFMLLIKPFIDLFQFMMILRSTCSRYVRWGHVLYTVEGFASVCVSERTHF